MENIEIREICFGISFILYIFYIFIRILKVEITENYSMDICEISIFTGGTCIAFSSIPILWISKGNVIIIAILYIIVLYFTLSPLLNYYIANIYKKLMKTYNNYKIIHTTYSIKKLDNEQLLGVDTNDIYCLYETYKNHSKSICVDSLSNITEVYNKLTNYKNELINNKLMKLKDKNTNLYKEYNDNTINLIINTK